MNIFCLLRLPAVLCILGLGGLYGDVFSQSTDDSARALRDRIGEFGDQVLYDSALGQRVVAFDSIGANLVAFFSSYPDRSSLLEEVESISYVVSQDDRLHLVTWQLHVNPDSYRYGGVLFLPQSSSNTVVLLHDVEEDLNVIDLEYETMSSGHWHGVLYYDLARIGTHRYVLFGYDGYNRSKKRKVLDVIELDDNGMPHWGAQVFGERGQSLRDFKKRYVLEFSSEAPARLFYDREGGRILLEQVVEVGLRDEMKKTILAPNGFFSGFEIDRNEGLCYYIHDVDP